MSERPRCVILAGPNGAGKSTHAARLVEGIYGIATYINPDTIASGFGVASVDSVAFDAGRIALSAVRWGAWCSGGRHPAPACVQH